MPVVKFERRHAPAAPCLARRLKYRQQGSTTGAQCRITDLSLGHQPRSDPATTVP